MASGFGSSGSGVSSSTGGMNTSVGFPRNESIGLLKGLGCMHPNVKNKARMTEIIDNLLVSGIIDVVSPTRIIIKIRGTGSSF